MRLRVRIPRLHLRNLHLRSTRAATVALVGVVAGATGVAGIAHELTLAEQQTPVERAPEAEASPSLRAVIPAGLREAAAADSVVESDVRREPVGPPGGYRGSIAKAPVAAVAAYQRAEAVINEAADCGLDWLVLAAVGRVESNHGQGQERDHRVTKRGRVRPAYVGAPLNGKGGRGEVADTERGELDGDKRWDAPVGPMGLLPTTWSSVAVDADADGRRDPQDLDDAALGAAVLLCAEIAQGREAAALEGGGVAAPAAGGLRTSTTVGPGPIAPHGGFEAQAADGLRTSTTVGPGKASDRGLLRAALREYHDGKRFVSTVLALRQRYAKQAEKIPPFQPPPGGLEIPELPPLCECDPPPTRDDDGAADESEPEVGGDRGGETGQPDGGGNSGSPSTGPSEPSTDPTDPPSTDDPTDPTDEPTSPTEPSEPTDSSTPTEPSPTTSETTSDPPASSDPSITP